MRPRYRRLDAPRQRGQALTEFIVLALALIPVFLLMPLLAKYQDIAHATQLASRYVAFEAMLHNEGMSSWKPEQQLADEVRRRFFSNGDAPIKTGDTAGDFDAHQNLFWRDPKGDALIPSLKDGVKVSFGPGQAATHADAFTGAADGTPFLAPIKNALHLNSAGIYTANVTVTLAKLPAELSGYTNSYEEFKALDLSITRHTSVVIDSWTAKDPAKVESRLHSAVVFPGVMFDSGVGAAAKTALDLAVQVVESPSCFKGGCTKGPKLGELEVWRDVVPADRLH